MAIACLAFEQKERARAGALGRKFINLERPLLDNFQ